MSTRIISVLSAVGLAGQVFGCAEPVPPPPSDILSLGVYAAQASGASADPYSGVAFIRIAVSNSSGTIMDKFVQYEPNGARSLESVPFGDDLQVTIEGWSMNSSTGLIGDLVSRGRSKRFDVSPESDPFQVNIMFARVNEFSKTMAVGPTGPYPTNLNVGRVGHTVTVLDDGRVLIVGGAQVTPGKTGDITGPDDLATIFDSVEIYDAKTGIYTLLETPMANARAFHTATLLPDGRVIMTGGITDIGGSKQTLTTMQIFDPKTDSFDPVGVGAIAARAAHSAVLLDGQGHLMFAGGFGVDQAGIKATLASVEVFCVAGFSCATPDEVVYTTNMSTTRAFHTATRLPLGEPADDAVLLIGGEGEDGVRSSMETFRLNPAGIDPSVVEMLSGPRTRHTATYVPSQRYLHVVGGFSDVGHTQAVQQIDSLAAATGVFQGVQDFFSLHARGGHAAVLMSGNAIVIAGGYDSSGALASAEVIFEYRSQEDGKTYIDRGGVESMAAPRGGLGAALLPNDTVLMVGGVGLDGTGVTAGEFFNPL